ncbi:MAG TPA: NAD(P)H-hydrate dehydratase [Mycobacteriales bacterium]|nr:NAD(P)H-hydrate dehydratase [Mycobacteriales bacterium]
MVQVTADLLRQWALPAPGGDGDKHDRGTVVVLGGTTETPGAVLLAGLAALRAGAGRLQIVTVEPTSAALGVTVPEALVVGLAADSDGGIDPAALAAVDTRLATADALVLGPGLSRGSAPELIDRALRFRKGAPVVVDAGALAGLAALGRSRDLLGAAAVLTPNSGELAALLDTEDAVEDETTAAAVAERYGAVVVIRGWVVAPDGSRWHNAAGNPGLGTSGSGDVLAGLVAGLLARGATPAQAGVWGQHLHATAGDRLAERIGGLTFLARELLDEVPAVIRDQR